MHRMCELFALNANVPVAATFSFRGLAARGGLTGDHVDGFGMAFHDGLGCRVFVDDAPASRSPLATFLSQQPLRAPTVLAHVRKATQGGVSLANCHPFRRDWAGRSWLFAHNGDLRHFNPALDEHFHPVGQTDSERAFCWLLQRLQQHFGGAALPAWPELAAVLHPWLEQLGGHGVFNAILSDGRGVLAHATTRLSWLQRQHPFGTVRLIDQELELDLAAANRPGDRMVLLATSPLTHAEPWHAFEAGETRLFVDGRSVWHARSGEPTGTRLMQAA
jgi:predicted glutamine amidotransferase